MCEMADTTCSSTGEITIRRIAGEDTLEIRRNVMWPDKNIDELRLPEDESGMHFGLFENSQLVSIVSLFVQGDTAQFRKFATLSEFQNQGYGSCLLQYIISECQKLGVKKLWCNARTEKSSFYQRFGFTESNTCFDRDGKSYLIMELTMPAAS